MSSESEVKVNRQWCRRYEEHVEPEDGIVQPAVVPPLHRPGRMTNQLKAFSEVVRVLWREDVAQHFRYPVDTIAQGLPDYHELIYTPMDLNTIKNRIKHKYYWSVQEAIEDVKLVFRNCQLYFDEDTPTQVAGQKLNAIFIDKIGQLIDLDDEHEIKEDNDDNNNRSASPVSSPMKPLVKAERQKISNVSYEHLDYLIERSYCEHVVNLMVNNLEISWPFLSADKWREFSANPKYNHDKEEKLDWDIIKRTVKSDLFNNIHVFRLMVVQMHDNASKCFRGNKLVGSCVKRSATIFCKLLRKCVRSVAAAKVHARKVISRRICNESELEIMEIDEPEFCMGMTANDDNDSNCSVDTVINKSMDEIRIDLVAAMNNAGAKRKIKYDKNMQALMTKHFGESPSSSSSGSSGSPSRSQSNLLTSTSSSISSETVFESSSGSSSLGAFSSSFANTSTSSSGCTSISSHGSSAGTSSTDSSSSRESSKATKRSNKNVEKKNEIVNL